MAVGWIWPRLKSGLARQCLDRRIPDQSALRREVGAWQQQRIRDAIRVDWRSPPRMRASN